MPNKCYNLAARILSNRCAILAAWQIASVLLTAGGTTVSYIATFYGYNIPLLMMAIGYSLLVLITCWKLPKSKIAYWRYAIVAILLVAGDYTGIQSYNMTAFASALCFISTVSFWVAPAAWIILGRKITIFQFLAILLGIFGSILVFIADGSAGNGWVGNVLALISAITYAIGTVLQEYLVHEESLHVYLFRVAITGAPIAIILTGSLEWKIIRDFEWTVESSLLTATYCVILILYYIYGPFVMQFSDATVYNLSMLTSNFYSLFISIFAFGYAVSWLYLVGFFCVPLAIAFYTLATPKAQPQFHESSEVENDAINEILDPSSSSSSSPNPSSGNSTPTKSDDETQRAYI